MIGIDVVDVARLRALLERTPRLEERLFTTEERAYCRAFADPVRHLAGTLAAKEAVLKAARLGTLPGWAQRVVVRRDEDGVPHAHVAGRDDLERVEVSISHDAGIAVAAALTPSR